jgi:hypothetical protein
MVLPNEELRALPGEKFAPDSKPCAGTPVDPTLLVSAVHTVIVEVGLIGFFAFA